VKSGDAEIASKHTLADGKITIDLASDLLLHAGQKLEVVIA